MCAAYPRCQTGSFSKASSLLNLLHKIAAELTFENIHQLDVCRIPKVSNREFLKRQLTAKCTVYKKYGTDIFEAEKILRCKLDTKFDTLNHWRSDV